MTATVTQDTLDTRHLPIERVHPNPANIRSDLGDLTALIESVRTVGVHTPVVVHQAGDDWMLIFGHRRLAAATAAGLDTIPAVVRDEPDAVTLYELMLSENVDRAQLDPIDEAHAVLAIKTSGRYRRLEDLAGRVHRSKDWVAARLKLLTLPEAVWSLVRDATLPVAQAVDLARLELPGDQVADLAARPPQIRTNELARLHAERRTAKRRCELEAEYGELSSIGELHVWRRDHPWGIVELGDDDDSMLDIPVGLHRGCDGHRAVLHHDGSSASAWCVTPLVHWHAGSWPRAPRTTWPKTARPLAEMNWSWDAVEGHAEHCPHHRRLELPWATVDVCAKPTQHTNPRNLGYQPPDELARLRHESRGPRQPGDPVNGPPRWRAHPHARRLLGERLVEQAALLDDWAGALVEAALREHLGTDDEWPYALAAAAIDTVEDFDDYPDRIDDFDARFVDGHLAAVAACVDAGDPPPNLDAIRTRFDVLTRGATTQENTP